MQGASAIAEIYGVKDRGETLKLGVSVNNDTSLGLVDFDFSGDKNFKVTLVNYILPPPKELKIFKGKTWEVNKGGILDYFGQERIGHATLKIERWNKERQLFELARYVSYPDGNRIEEDINSSYLGRRKYETILPPISETEVKKFDEWFRDSPYSKDYGYFLPNDLAEKRFEIKKKISGILGLNDIDGKELFKKTPFGDKLTEAVNRGLEIEKITAEVAKLDSENKASSKKYEVKRNALASLQDAQNKWYEDASIKLDQLNNDEFLENIKGLVQNEVYAKIQLVPMSPQEEMKYRNEMVEAKNQLRKRLILPINYDVSDFLNPENPWDLAKPEDIIKKIHGVDILKEGEWSNFVNAHETEFRAMIPLIFEVETPDDARTIDAHLGELKSMTWNDYKGNALASLIQKFESSRMDLHSRGPENGLAYGKAYSEYGKNCSCAVGESLNVIYDQDGYFNQRSLSDPIVNPQSVAKRARQYVSEFEAKKASLNTGADSKFGGLAAMTMVAISAVLGNELGDAIHLANGDSLKKCFEDEQQRFYKESDGAFRFMQTSRFEQSVRKHFLLESP